jgi:ATP-dependent protease ClpP protease subunit
MNAFYQIKAVADGAEILLYGPVGDFGLGEDCITAKRLHDELAALGEVGTIDLHINSDGGLVFEGLAIYNMLKAHKAHKRVHVDGVAASCASLIAMAGDEIVMPANAYLMIHEPRSMAVGTVDDMLAEAEILDKLRLSMAAIYAARTGRDQAECLKWMADETWFTGEEALAAGLCTYVIEEVRIAAQIDLAKFKRVPAVLAALGNTPNKGGHKRMEKLTAFLASSLGVTITEGTEEEQSAVIAALEQKLAPVAAVPADLAQALDLPVDCALDAAKGAVSALLERPTAAALADVTAKLADTEALAKARLEFGVTASLKLMAKEGRITAAQVDDLKAEALAAADPVAYLDGQAKARPEGSAVPTAPLTIPTTDPANDINATLNAAQRATLEAYKASDPTGEKAAAYLKFLASKQVQA